MHSNDRRTQNGALCHSTTGSFNLDLFQSIGSARGSDLSDLFTNAYHENKDHAVRILQYARDVRGGMGERSTFIKLLVVLASLDLDAAISITMKIPELGRYKDLVELFDTPLKQIAYMEMIAGITSNNGLAAKWAPRKGKHALALSRLMNLSPKAFRHTVVGLSNTVEQKMCARKWEEIDFSKLPSIASARYQKAFSRNALESYSLYIDGLHDGTEKVNATAIFPHEVILAARRGVGAVADAQWKALPDYINSDVKILPVVDVSGSMDQNAGSSSSVVKCMDVSTALGLYISERNTGIFKDTIMTFDTRPTFVKLDSSEGIKARDAKLRRAPWGGSTDFNRSMQILLDLANKSKLDPSDMPDILLVLSDMEFNEAENDTTNLNQLRIDYDRYGYTLPKIVFWNLSHRAERHPAKHDDAGVSMVSGFSPAIIKSVLACKNVDPIAVMLEAIMTERYKI